MKDLFDPTNQNGIKLSLMRHTVGQSDLTPSSLGQWSYDENGGTHHVLCALRSILPVGESDGQFGI